jgi:hypothetical protein
MPFFVDIILNGDMQAGIELAKRAHNLINLSEQHAGARTSPPHGADKQALWNSHARGLGDRAYAIRDQFRGKYLASQAPEHRATALSGLGGPGQGTQFAKKRELEKVKRRLGEVYKRESDAYFYIWKALSLS